MSRTAYLNGDWVPESDLKISAWDLATMQGASCFEMCRSFHHEHFKLRAHLQRLVRSCARLSIPFPCMPTDLLAICEDVTARNPMPDADEHRLVIVVNAGAPTMYREIEGVIPHAYCYVATFPLRFTVAGFGRYFTEGVHGVTSDIQQVPDACVPSSAKHRSRLHFHLAQQQAPAGTWPLLRDAKGFYCEAPGANLVTVRQGRIGLLDAQALPGISMQTVRELTDATSDTWTRRQHRPDELWLTGTPFCLLPVVSLDGTPIGDGTPGPVFKETLAKWNALVGLDIAQQIMDWDAKPVGQEGRIEFTNVWTPDAQRLSAIKS